jgi:RNA polymerase sigma-70 factor (ECF subfamily)
VSQAHRSVEGTANAEEFFEVIYRQTYRRTLAYVLRRTDNRADAHDVVAEIYLVAWRRLEDLRQLREPQAWLYAVAYKTQGNHLRSTRRRAGLAGRALSMGSSEVALGGPDLVFEERDEFGRVMAALATLSVRDQEILRLVAFESLSHTEIGKVLGIRSSLVRTKLYRARKKLNDALDGLATPPLGETGHIKGVGGSQGKGGEASR